MRELLHTRATVHLDLPDPAAIAHGVVADAFVLEIEAQR